MQAISYSDLPFGKKTIWKPTFVDPVNGHIFCQLAEPSVSIKCERLHQGIKKGTSDKLQKAILDPVIGDICLAKSNDNGEWYRSQVTQVDSNMQQVEVFFIDHGSNDIVSYNSLCEIPSLFSVNHLPPQSHECILANVEPILGGEKWSNHAIELIKELVLDQELPGVPIKIHRTLLVLKLFADPEGTITVADQLISAGFGHVKRSFPIGSTSGSSIARSISVSSISSFKSSNSSGDSLIKTLKPISFSQEQYVNFCVVFCKNINKFYCQNVNSKIDLDNMQIQLQNVYNNSNISQLSSMKVNLPCCAKFSDGQWYRGLIKQSAKNVCIIYFVDYGNTEEVSKKFVTELKEEFFILPVSAVECALSGVSPLPVEKTFSKKAKTLFEKLTMNNESMVGLISKVINDKLEIVLYDVRDKPIAEELIDRGLVCSNDFYNNNVSMMVNNSVSSESTKISTIVKYVSQELNIGSEVGVFVSHLWHPHDFYVHLSSSNVLNQFMTDFSNHYKTNNIDFIQNPVSEQPCVATFTEDDEYYRGVITKVTKSTADILFVDYGNSEEKPVAELKSLRKEFIKLPKQAIQCKLDGIEPLSDTFSAAAIKKFEELTLDRNLSMTIKRKKNSVYIVKLEEISQSNNAPTIDIATSLIQSGVVKESRPSAQASLGAPILSSNLKFKELKIDVDCFMDVAPVNILSPSFFCCHVVQYGAKFKDLTDELNCIYKNTIPDPMIKWQKLMPCVALFDVDDNWYRATITNVKSNQVDVNFVDFGNSATVLVDHVRAIFNKFMDLPAQVLNCTLADVVPKERDWSYEAVKEFENMVLDKHLAGHIKSKNAENIFSVVLYDTKNLPQLNVSQVLIQNEFAIPVDLSVKLGCCNFVVPKKTDHVVVTAIINPLKFWLQLVRSDEDLIGMMKRLNEYFSSIDEANLNVNNPNVGQYCCAKFTGDGDWYRAMVEKVNGNSVTVNYIDYGNSEELEIENIKVMIPEFEALPRFALLCQLAGVSSYPCWDKSINEMMINKEFDATFFTFTAPFTVELANGVTSVNKAIVDVMEESQTPDSKPALVASHVSSLTSQGSNQPFVIPPLPITKGSIMKVYFTDTSSADAVFCQRSNCENDLRLLMEKMNNYVAAGKALPAYLDVGYYCMAQSSDDERWYRARITDITDQVTVHLIDYGNTATVHKNMVKDLPRKFATLPKQALHCLFSDQAFVDSIDLTIEYSINILAVSRKGKVKAECLSFQSRSVKTPDVALPEDEKQPTILTYTMPTISKRFTGYCTFVSSVIKVQVQLIEFESQLSALMEELNEYAILAQSLSTCLVSSACAAQYSIDGQWYRAEVKEVKNDFAVVLFVDYGNEESVPTASLKSLMPEHMALPRTCVSCTLRDVCPTDIDAITSKTWLEENVLERTVVVEQICQSNDEIECYIYLEGHKSHVNNKLYEISGAVDSVTPNGSIRDSINAYSQSNLTQKESGLCTFVSSVHEVKVQLKSFESVAKALMDELEDYAPTAYGLNAFDTSMPCASKYTVDDQWYRARIQSVDADKATVYFVDYGNTDVVSKHSLKVLKPSMLALPETCVSCRLRDVHVEDIDIDEAMAWLEHNVLEQNVTLEIVDSSTNSLECYVYVEGIKGHLNDYLYKFFALENPNNSTVSSELIQTTRDEHSSQHVEENPVDEIATCIPSPTLQKGATYNVTCYVVESAFVLKCQLADYEEQLSTLMDEMASVSESSAVLSNPKPGDVCLAKFGVDNEWYRGRITGDGKVEFIDFGNATSVDQSDIKELKKIHALLPQTCVAVLLYDVHTSDIDVDATKVWLDQNILECALRCEVVSVENDCVVSAYVYREDSDEHINDQIYRQFAVAEDCFVDENVPQTQEQPLLIEAATVGAGTEETVTCTHVESAVLVKCQLHRFQSDLEKITASFTAYCDRVRPCSTLRVGEFCFAKYSKDGAWYRVEVLGLDGESVIIELVDYGINSLVNISDTRPMEASFSRLPRTSIDVVLHDVHVIDIDISKTKAWLEETILNKELAAKIVTIENGVEADLIRSGEESTINDQIYDRFPLYVEESVVDVTPSKNLLETTHYKEIKYADAEVNQIEKVICTYVQSATELCCQLCKYGSDIEKISQLLSQEPPSSIPSDMCIGKPVIVQSLDDKRWYRAVIIGIDTDVSVKYVDYGNQEKVPKVNIREVWNDDLLVAPTCFTFSLQDVLATDIEVNNVQAWLEEELIDQELTLTITTTKDSRKEARVLFADRRMESSINDMIYEKFKLTDYPIEDEKQGEEVNNVDPTIIDSSVDTSLEEIADINVQDFLWPELTAGSVEKGVCTMVESANLLKFQLLKYKGKLERLMDFISTHYDSQPRMRYLEKGSACLAMYEDLVWYRARVLNVNDAMCTVEFVDYGNIDDVITEDMRVIKKEMLLDHQYSLSCVLNAVDILPGQEADARHYLHQILVEEAPEVTLCINSVDLKKKVVYVTLEHKDMNLNDYMQQTFGPGDGVLRTRAIKLGEKLRITIPETDSLRKFWCVVEHDNDKLEALTDKLTNLCQSKEPPTLLTNIRADMPCCVFVARDDKWHRGTIFSVSNPLSVLLVDCGRIENVSTSDIRELKPEFFRLDVQAFQGTLFDLRPVKSDYWTLEAIRCFNAACKDTVITATIIKVEDNVFSLALMRQDGDTVYELLTRNNFAETKNQKTSTKTCVDVDS